MAIDRRIVLGAQLAGTALVLGWVPGNLAKLVIMAAIWTLGFQRFILSELALMAFVDVLFVIMNTGALRQGIFAFTHPDALGMPVYEFFMWGFYVLHTIRFVGGPVPHGKARLVFAFTAAFAVPFSTIADPNLLTFVSAVILIGSLAAFHDKMDFAYVGYMLFVGTVIEYVGTGTGQWTYPHPPLGGVPLWFITMWGGIGLFTRRLFLPIVYRGYEQVPASCELLRE